MGIERRLSSADFLLRETTMKINYYAEITATTGKITLPTGATVLMNQYGTGINAIISKIVNGVPDFIETEVDVTTFDAEGNYVLSDALPSNPTALIYYIGIKLKDYSNLDLSKIVDSDESSLPNLFSQLSDVLISSILDGEIIYWSNTAGKFKNTAKIKFIESTGIIQLGDIVGGNYTEFESDGTLKMIGDSTVFNDMMIPFLSQRTPASNAPTLSTFVGNLKQLTFALNDYLDLASTEFLHSYKAGSEFEIHLHFATNGVNVNDRTVKWEVEYTIANMLQVGAKTNFAASVVLTKEYTIPANTPSHTHIYLSISDVLGTDITIGANFVSRIKRIASSGTEPSGNPFALMLGIHIENDTLGSRTESGK